MQGHILYFQFSGDPPVFPKIALVSFILYFQGKEDFLVPAILLPKSADS